jgi:hypothetical protein
MNNKLQLNEYIIKLNEYYNLVFGRNIDTLSLNYYINDSNNYYLSDIPYKIFKSFEYINKFKQDKNIMNFKHSNSQYKLYNNMKSELSPIIHNCNKKLSKNFIQKIYLINQFYIDKNYERQKEILFCLKQNVNNDNFEKIYLFNERLYTKIELNLTDDEMKKIIQIDIGHRLMYKDIFTEVKRINLRGYIVFGNSDIFFDNSIALVKDIGLDQIKRSCGLSRFEYNLGSNLIDCKLIKNSFHTADIWIYHTNYSPCQKMIEKSNFLFGKLSCDNAIGYLFKDNGYQHINIPYTIKIYHYHTSNIRNYTYNDMTISNVSWTPERKFIIKYNKNIPYTININIKNNTEQFNKNEIYSFNNNNKSNLEYSKISIYDYNTQELFKKYNLFWQYPVITEKTFHNQNKYNNKYFGFPWATIIDSFICSKSINQRSKINKIIDNLIKTINFDNNYYTCCQHINFRYCISIWKKLNIKTVYASHKKKNEDYINGIKILPCPLYALNIENNNFNKKFKVNLLKKKRNILYSFIGGYVPSYMSNIRESIFNMKHPHNTIIKNTGEWHLQNIVYSDKQNMNGDMNINVEYNCKTEYYNKILINSRYSLCPSGSGPNSIRLWESLAAGSIPIILSDKLELPYHDDWGKTVLFIKENNLETIEKILLDISEKNENKMRENCFKLYNYFKDNYNNKEYELDIQIEKQKDQIEYLKCDKDNSNNTKVQESIILQSQQIRKKNMEEKYRQIIDNKNIQNYRSRYIKDYQSRYVKDYRSRYVKDRSRYVKAYQSRQKLINQQKEERKKQYYLKQMQIELKNNNIKMNEQIKQSKQIIHYCCGSYYKGANGGVSRYDYQISKIFPNYKHFTGPSEKLKMLNYLKQNKNSIIITDNHLACDIPNEYDMILVHHGVAKTHAERDPNWNEYWKSLCCDGQDRMLSYRHPKNTKIISISQFCTDEFTKHYGEKYTRYSITKVLHPSELNENKYKRFNLKSNNLPIVLGNWSTYNKGSETIKNISKNNNFNFKQLSISLNNYTQEGINDFNNKKQDIYLNSDIFLQISLCEGSSYSALDALLCGIPVVSSDVGFFYKDIPEDCFVKLDWKRNNDIEYINEKLKYAWENRVELGNKGRKWYMENCRFINWEKKMKYLIHNFS